MTSDRTKPGVPFWATVAVALGLPLSAYVGAYAWLATPGIALFNDAHHLRKPVLVDLPVDYGGRSTRIRRAVARREAEIEYVFAPIHWIDRRLRPEMWTWKVIPRDVMGHPVE